jgi:3-oxoacyl-[acyl-carrier protein] reductase
VTSHAVKAPVAMLALSNGARTGLTGFVAGLARSTAEHNVTINNLLPGTFDTDRLKSNLAALAKNSSREVGGGHRGDQDRQSDQTIRTPR